MIRNLLVWRELPHSVENRLWSIVELRVHVKEEDTQSYHKNLGYSLLKVNLAEFSLVPRTKVVAF